MKTLLIVSTEPHAGKSVMSLALGAFLRDQGTRLAYMKPISSSVSYATGEPRDRDAETIRAYLGLQADVKQIAPVALEGPFLQEAIESGDRGFRERILQAHEQLSRDKDFVLLEGRRFLGLGVGAGLSDFDIAERLDASILVITRYDGEEAVDRVLCAVRLLGGEERIVGVVINSVSMESQLNQVIDVFAPFLDERGAEVMGIVPYDHSQRSVTVEEVVERLGGRVITEVPLNKEIQYFRLGAGGPESSLRAFRRTPDLGVITGGDRVEIQQVALRAPSLRCLILTGNTPPEREVVRNANERGVPILLVAQEPMAAAALCESVLNYSRMHLGPRLDRAVDLLHSNVDLDRIIEKVPDR